MPIIVMQKIKLTIRYISAPSQPKSISQIMLAIGCLSKLVLTFFPKGKRTNFASLKHCLPKGMPIIVMHSINPTKQKKIALHKPMKINQMMLPKISLPLFYHMITLIVTKFCIYY